MKDFDQIPAKDNKVISAEERQVRPSQHVGQMRPLPSARLYSFNLADGSIAEVKPTPVEASFGGKVTKRVEQLPNHLYASALNKKNVIRKFIKMYENLVAAGKIARPQPTYSLATPDSLGTAELVELPEEED